MKKLTITLVFAFIGLCSAQLIIDLDESPDVFIPAPSLVKSSELSAYVKEDASNFADYPQTMTISGSDAVSGNYSFSGNINGKPTFILDSGNANIIWDAVEARWEHRAQFSPDKGYHNSDTDLPSKTGWVDADGDPVDITLSYTLPAQDFVSAIGAQEYEANGTNFVMTLVYTNGLYQMQLVEEE